MIRVHKTRQFPKNTFEVFHFFNPIKPTLYCYIRIFHMYFIIHMYQIISTRQTNMPAVQNLFITGARDYTKNNKVTK